MKRMLLSRLAALVIICLATAPVVPATAQTPIASPVATADPFALPPNLRILRIYAGNGFDYLRLDDGRLAYLNGDLVDDGLSTVPVPQWLETWYTDMRVVDHTMTYVVMVPEASAGTDLIIIDIRLLSFPDHDAASAAVPATYDVLLRQATEDPATSQGITMLTDLPRHDGAIIGVTGTDPSLNLRTGAQSLFRVPFTRFIAQQGAIVASVKVASVDEAFNDALARELLATQLACLGLNKMCVPVPIPAKIPFESGAPAATPVAARPVSRSRARRHRKWHAPCNDRGTEQRVSPSVPPGIPRVGMQATARRIGIMDEDTSGLAPRKGMTIIGSDGEEVGEIDVVEANYVIVRKGLFPQDYYIPVGDIASRDDDTLRLAIPAQEALDRGLGNPMVGAESERAAMTDTTAPAHDLTLDEVDRVRDTMADTDVVDNADTSLDDTAGTEIVSDEPEPTPLHADVGEEEAIVDAADTPEPEPLHAEADEVETIEADEPVHDDMHRTVTLSEEELSATTRPVERGVVRVQKQVSEEKVTLEVPLVEDEVHVTRRAVNREITADDAAFEERTIEVPLRGQGVEIEKQAHVVEEVEIGKTAHQEIREVTETVRHETARVEGQDVVEVPDADAERKDQDEPTAT